MSFSEESLEDKIAAIMRGNYNFGPPIKPPAFMPVPAAAALPPPATRSISPPSIQLSTKSSQNSLSDAQSERVSTDVGDSNERSPTNMDTPAPLSASNSGKGITTEIIGGNAEKVAGKQTPPLMTNSEQSSTKSKPDTQTKQSAGNLSRKGSSESLQQATKSAPVETTPSISLIKSVEVQPSSPIPGTLTRKGTALVGFGEVYDDVTNNVEYDEKDLHRDAVSDGYVGAVTSTNSFSFGNVYGDADEDVTYDKTDTLTSLQQTEEDEPEGIESPEEDVIVPSEPAPASKLLAVEVPAAPAPKAASPVPVPAPEPVATTDLQDQLLDKAKELKKQPSMGSTEDLQSKVQPQLEFVPLSLRKSPQDSAPLAAEDKGLALDRERLSTADKKDRISPTDPPLLRASPHSSFVLAPTAEPIARAAPEPPRASPPQQQPTVDEVQDKVHSLLFGEDHAADEDDEGWEEQLDFSPDPHHDGDGGPQIDEDSLGGEEHDDALETSGHEGYAEPEDLAQTIRTTIPLSPAVRTSTELPKSAPQPTPEKEKAKPIKVSASATAAPEMATTTVMPSSQPPTLGLPPKPRATTPTSLARGRAALLLPTIPEEKPPAASAHRDKATTPAKPAAAHPAAVSVPIKAPASTDSKDRSNFLSRISAATSVQIEVPPAPVVAAKPVVAHKESKEKHHKEIKEKEHKEKEPREEAERSTTPTSVPKPSTTTGSVGTGIPQRSTTPTTITRPSATKDTPAAAAKPAPSTAAPRSVPRETVPKPQPSAAVHRASSPPSARKAPAEAPPPSSAKKGVVVMMSSTSADEIAAASAQSAGSSVKGGTSKGGAVTGVKESTLLSSPPPQKEHQKSSAVAPASAKKAKPEAWVIDSTPVQSAPAEAPVSATKRSSVKAAAWMIENASSKGKASPAAAVPEPVPASPMPALKEPTRSRTPEPIQRAAAPNTAANRTSIPVTAPKNASLSAKLSQSPEADAAEADKRSRAVSPNTTAKSVSRLAPPHAAGASADDAPLNERAVKVAVRVRPFTALEVQQGQRRTISMNDDKLVIVNPKSFDREPDAVAKVAVATENRQWANLFEFDNVLWDFNPTTGVETLVDQVELHRSLGLEIVENALSGISSSCFAYGHTCTGKTYSLFGADMLGQDPAGKREPVSKIPTSLAKFSITSESGLIQRVFHDVIRLSHKNTRMFVTFMEIYNEKIRDLLSDNPASVSQSLSDVHSNGSTTGRIHAPTHVVAAPDALKLREHPTFGPYVENLTKVEVFSVNDALRLIAKGQANRTSAQTVWNANSSRSHAVVTLELSPTEIDPSKQFVDPRAREVYENSHSPVNSPAKLPAQGASEDDLHSLEGRMEASNREHLRHYEAPQLQQVVRVQMVDLAGSEKDTMNGDEEAVWSGGRYNDTTLSKFPDSQAEKEKNELRLIRRSLSTLGFIIKALTKGATMRSLPYRDCTLTFLLRDALCGRNHTTMLATISPAHTCYEETLSTLRYAERLCEVHTNRKKAAAASGFGVGTLTGNVLGPRKAILDEFMRVHQGLRAFKRPTSTLSRDLLRQTLADPQQRARLTNNPASSSNSGGPASAYPINGFAKPLAEVSEEEFEHLKDSFRRLTTDVVEMQIDLDAVRTDRDTLMVELRGATDMLNELESAKNEARSQVGSLTKYLRAAEKELADLHGLLKKRDETVDRLLGELTEEKQARGSAEQAYQARTKEFLARFGALKKENKVLAGSLDTVSDKHKSTADDKKDQAQQIERLRAQVKLLTQQRDTATAEVEKIKEDHASVGKKYDAASVKVGRLEDLEKQLTGLILQNEKHKSEVSIVSSERDSLKAMLGQKDAAMQAQSQQSERSVRMLQMKLTALERTLALSGARSDAPQAAAVSSDSEYAKLQERVSALLSAEGNILHSELADTKKLTAVVKDMRLKLQEFEDLKFELQLERSAKEDLQKRLTEHSVNSQVSEVGKSALDHQVSLLQIELHQAHEANKKQAREHQLQSEVFEGNKASLEEQVSALQKELLTTKDALALTKARLLQQTNLAAKSTISSMDFMKLQAESAALKDQLILTQRDAFTAREELKQSQESMQAEYSGMWNSVQELSKLDALKDQSIQDLIMDRDKAILERDGALERFVAAKTESAQLLQELQDIDVELLHAVEAGEYRLSPRGQHKSIMLHNVSDRTMFGLARRQQQAQQTLQALHLPTTAAKPAAAHPHAQSHGGAGVFSAAGTPGGMSISQQMGLVHTSHLYDSPGPAPVSASSTPVLMFNHPSHVNPPPAGPQYTLPQPALQGPGSLQHQQAQQRYPGPPPQMSAQGFPQQKQSQQGQHGASWSSAQSTPAQAPGNYARSTPPQIQQQQQRPPQAPAQTPPVSQQFMQQQQQQQQQSQHQQYAYGQAYPPQQQQRASIQQQAANREEKEYAMSEEALEKELEELSVLEGEARSKRQRMKSSTGLSSSNTSMSSINIHSASASARKAAPNF